MSFSCAARGFDHQRGVGIAQTRHVEGEVGFACGCRVGEKIGGFRGGGDGYGDSCSGEGMPLRVGNTQLQSRALSGEPGFCIQQFDG